MNIYKAPNLIISPKRKAYRRGKGGGALNDESIYTHIHLSQCKEEKATGTGKDVSLEPI